MNHTLTKEEEWQNKFLTKATEIGLGDLSIMIGTVSEIRHNAVKAEMEMVFKYIVKIQENIEAGGANENLTLATILCSELRIILNPQQTQ